MLCLGNVSGGTRRRADALALSDLSSPRSGTGRARQVLTRSRRSRARRCVLGRGLDIVGQGTSGVRTLSAHPRPVCDARRGPGAHARARRSRARRANLDGAGQALDVRTLDALPARQLDAGQAARRPDLDALSPRSRARQALDVRTWLRFSDRSSTRARRSTRAMRSTRARRSPGARRVRTWTRTR